MNAEQMIDYVLGKVDGAERERLDHAVRQDGELSARVEMLRLSIYRIVDDGTAFEHPPELSRRTVAFVAKNRRSHRSLQDYVPIRLPFRWADLAVAASILAAGVLTLLPAIQRSRERMNQAGCVLNLQQLGNGIAQYASLNPSLPYPSPTNADLPSGSFACILHDAGCLNDLRVLDCPCNGVSPQVTKDLANFDQIDHIRHTDPERLQRMLSWDYAYNVGYRHASGRPGPIDSRQSSLIPVVADQPDHDMFQNIRHGNSPNHRGRGQNVLFSDGNVHWFRTRHVSPNDPDLYLNNNRLPQPGVHQEDSVLVPSKIPFRGK
jgi:hypothetical protein